MTQYQTQAIKLLDKWMASNPTISDVFCYMDDNVACATFKVNGGEQIFDLPWCGFNMIGALQYFNEAPSAKKLFRDRMAERIVDPSVLETDEFDYEFLILIGFTHDQLVEFKKVK